MRSRYAWTACLSLLVVQMTPGGRADVGVATEQTDTAAPLGLLESHSKRTIAMHRVDFEPETFRITPATAPVLDEAVELLGRDSDPVAVVISPSVDNNRSETFRLFTARQRAKAVRTFGGLD